jgi:hypothetical protein
VEYHKKSAGVWVQATIARVGCDKAGVPFYTVGVVFAKGEEEGGEAQTLRIPVSRKNHGIESAEFKYRRVLQRSNQVHSFLGPQRSRRPTP